ncbi:MAG: polyphosphate kinase 2 family protein [Planctomycetaceae bacterium]|nr:polyphosphate kinase 2 family protein [Planctomycetaceae bacterium]
MSDSTRFKPGKSIKLADYDPADTGGVKNKGAAEEEIAAGIEKIADLSFRLYAEARRSVLLILQGMDTSGKDGTIRHVMTGVNPLTCEIVAFKEPTTEELDHDFLWRIHRAVPRRGKVGIFNRSQYEDVLVVRVKHLAPESVWRPRYGMINAFEKLLTQNDTTIVKCFLHISKDEQRKRLQARIDDPHKRWKFNLGDLADRRHWDDYQQAYEDALNECNTAEAPWHIVPSDKKWYRNLVVTRILLRTLTELDPHFPPAKENLEGIVVE